MERTLLLVKPDGVQRGLVGQVVDRFERRGLHLIGLKLMQMDRALAERHYAEHVGKPFFESLVSFITSAPIVAMVWEGPGAVATCRLMMGATNPADSAPGTIRGDYALTIGMNVVHGSDSVGRASTEVALFFEESELVSWTSATHDWVAE